MFKPTLRSLAICSVAATSLPMPTLAESSTSRGEISVVQVFEMLEKAPVDGVARQVLVAYLGGLGEAAGALVSLKPGTCRLPLSLDAEHARRAIQAAGAASPGETAATPIILRDMLARAKCRSQ